MNCPSCDRELPNDATFCGYCGNALRPEQVCSACGRSNPADMRFCLGCGSSMMEPTPAPVPVPAREPLAYTPKHLADKILQSKSALEGDQNPAPGPEIGTAEHL